MFFGFRSHAINSPPVDVEGLQVSVFSGSHRFRKAFSTLVTTAPNYISMLPESRFVLLCHVTTECGSKQSMFYQRQFLQDIVLLEIDKI